MSRDPNLIDAPHATAVPSGGEALALPARPAATEALADLFVLPPPLPDPAVAAASDARFGAAHSTMLGGRPACAWRAGTAQSLVPI